MFYKLLPEYRLNNTVIALHSISSIITYFGAKYNTWNEINSSAVEGEDQNDPFVQEFFETDFLRFLLTKLHPIL